MIAPAPAVLAVDPGYKQSAFCLAYNGQPKQHGILANECLLAHLMMHRPPYPVLVVEQVESMGMAVGKEVFETVFWSGRFVQCWPGPFTRITRRDVKLHLCGQARAKDSNIRQALLDRFGPDKDTAVGGKRCPKRKNKSHGRDCPICSGSGWAVRPGPLYGVSKDVWAALAVAVTWTDKQPAWKEAKA